MFFWWSKTIVVIHWKNVNAQLCELHWSKILRTIDSMQNMLESMVYRMHSNVWWAKLLNPTNFFHFVTHFVVRFSLYCRILIRGSFRCSHSIVSVVLLCRLFFRRYASSFFVPPITANNMHADKISVFFPPGYSPIFYRWSLKFLA